MKKLLALISVLLVITLVSAAVTPAAVAAPWDDAASETAEQGNDAVPRQVPDTTEENDTEAEDTRRSVYDNGVIFIYSYEQLMLIGSGEALTDTDDTADGLGRGETIAEGGGTVAYAFDGTYRLACDIALPRHTLWRLPDGLKYCVFHASGMVSGS